MTARDRAIKAARKAEWQASEASKQAPWAERYVEEGLPDLNSSEATTAALKSAENNNGQS